MATQFQETLDKLHRLTGHKPQRGSGGWYITRCPNHADNKESLGVLESDKGFPIYHCFAGCNWQDIRNRVENNTCVAPKWEPREEVPLKIVAKYIYTDENNKPLYRKLRYEPKTFRLQRYANGHWITGLKDTRLVLYNLPAVVRTDFVLIVEGEKEVDAWGKLGLTATCSAMGGSKGKVKWESSYNANLAGKRLLLLPHNDAAGVNHMIEVAKQNLATAKDIRVVNLPVAKKADSYDWLEVGNTVDDLRELWLATESFVG